MTTVLLALPPLIQSNFGQIYPSTAVLASYLVDRGHDPQRIRQIDLNDRFVDHILDRRELEIVASGGLSRAKPTHRAAARWSLRHLAEGQVTPADFRASVLDVFESHPLASVLRLLSSPYLVDPDLATLTGEPADGALSASYDQFFARCIGEFAAPSDEPLLIGLSSPMGPQLFPTMRLARILADRLDHPDFRIVVGGPSLSLLAEEELSALLEANPAVDAIVRYDGEIPLASLTRQLSGGEWDPGRVPGVSTIVEGKARHVPPAPGPRLNDLSTPRYDREMLKATPTRTLGVYQARGCYWGQCDYCDFVEVYKGSRSYRGRRPELVLADIEHLTATTGVRRYRLITESIPPAFARRFSELLIESELDTRWSSFAMVDRRFDRELLELMARSGCETLVVGLESMVTRALKLVHKSADREENFRFVRDAHQAGIRVKVNLIPDLPTTTPEEAMAGLADLEELAECFSGVSIFGFEPTRSSRVGESPESFGFIPIDSLRRGTHAQFAANTLAVVDPAMTSEERARVTRAYHEFAERVNTRRNRARGTAHSDLNFRTVLPDTVPLTIFDLATAGRMILGGRPA